MHKDENIFDTGIIVDEALKTDLNFSLSENFADVLAEKVTRKFVWQQYIKEFLIYVGVLVGIAVVSAAMSLIWFGSDWKVWLSFIDANVGLVAGINIITIFILFSDRVLLRYFMFKSKMELG